MAIQRRIIDIETAITEKPVVFDIHPNEFLNEEDGNRIIKRRSENIIDYMLKDLLRSKLKVKNLGKDAVPLYINEIDFYFKRKYKFLTMKEYVTSNFH